MSKIAQAESALNAKLESLQDPEWDSSDDNEDDDEVEEDENKELVEDLSKKSRGSKKATPPSSRLANVLYIGHLPTHMEDTELAGFLKQFGTIVRLRVSRSDQTGKSRGYAFVQMKSAEVAAIIADTLSGYLIMGEKRLVCHVVPPEKVHPGLFSVSKKARQKLANRSKPLPQTKNLNKLKEITSKLVQRERKKRKALEKMGIDYDFPGYEGSTTKKEEGEKKQKKKRKDSVSSVTSTDSASKKKKRKDSIASVDSAKSDNSKSRKRKESIDSTKSEGSRKRKDSIASVDSIGSESKKQRRKKQSDAGGETPKSKTTTREVVSAQTKKKKKTKKDKKRRNSSG